MGAWMLFSPKVWLVIGFTGQALFTARFLVQWLVSEKRRDSVVPVAFWWHRRSHAAPWSPSAVRSSTGCPRG